MSAINHAATALIIKKEFPNVPIYWILISGQFMEIVWTVECSDGFRTVIPMHPEHLSRCIPRTMYDLTEVTLDNRPLSHYCPQRNVLRRNSWPRGDYPCERLKKYCVCTR